MMRDWLVCGVKKKLDEYQINKSIKQIRKYIKIAN